MSAIWSFLRSTIGLKVQMAVSGFLLFGFLVEHMVGMLLFFKGPATLNGYGSLLRYSPAALWTARTVIFSAALVPYLDGRRSWFCASGPARPIGYRTKKWRCADTSYAARTMKFTGTLGVPVRSLSLGALHVGIERNAGSVP
jgi:succinate dehydrogenase / fumarate reductase cytochrome b subunit